MTKIIKDKKINKLYNYKPLAFFVIIQFAPFGDFIYWCSMNQIPLVPVKNDKVGVYRIDAIYTSS